MNKIKLDRILVKNNRVDYYFSLNGKIQKYFNEKNNMFLEYNYDLSDIPESILAIPFVSNVIPLVWLTDTTLTVDQLDKSFFYCLTKVKQAYQRMFNKFEFKGDIKVNKIVNNQYVPEREAASLFSGGLDALTTFIRIKDKKPLLITEYGWHEDNIKYSEVWEADKKHVISFAEGHGLENILIQSNYGTFIKAKEVDADFSRKLGDTWWHGLHHSLAIISSAIPIAFKIKVKCLYIASSNSPAYPVACASDPTVDNEIRFGTGEVYHDGYELSRQDKVKVVTDYYSSNKEVINIRVCFKNEDNCCKCEKCLRTIFGILAEGQNPRDFGFEVPGDFSEYVKVALNNEVKFFTDTFIRMYWKVIQNRMRENSNYIKYSDILNWFLNYDFEGQRRKSLLKYRVTNFFPILKRKFSIRLRKILS
ncbi:peptidase [Neobacillus sp. 179-C4.2 HS]|uniref:Peptidase n=1 Tax=Neobacillus driksii TaxID=3035913 RepID=A0ABV4Z1J5_9BACI|nr:peptidase [Neobacillus sp. 179.-C4.2 HS]MDP5195976.1 peptidase [Neobacillus sp. 179.-C4.2 HS]